MVPGDIIKKKYNKIDASRRHNKKNYNKIGASRRHNKKITIKLMLPGDIMKKIQ